MSLFCFESLSGNFKVTFDSLCRVFLNLQCSLGSPWFAPRIPVVFVISVGSVIPADALGPSGTN